jgi:hypothetical protein
MQDAAAVQMTTALTGQDVVPGQPAPAAPATTDSAPGATPAPARRQWLRQHINVNRLGAAVAIGTLLFTGVATYFQAEISQEQLNESRGEAGQHLRAQASEVTFWGDLEVVSDSRALKVHLMNRSVDPVTRVSFHILIRPPEVGHPLQVFAFASPLPPCTEVTYDPAHLESAEHKTWAGTVGMPVLPLFMDFTDANGKGWRRTSTELTEQEVDPWGGNLITMPETTSRVEFCGQTGP